MNAVKRRFSIGQYAVCAYAIILIVSSLTFLLSSCTKELEVNPFKPQQGNMVTVNFAMKGMKQTGNEVITRSHSEMSPEIVTVLLGDDLYMVATLEADRPVQTRASTSGLPNGTLLRIVAYLNEETYFAHADYTVDGNVLVSDNDLQVVANNKYKFVAYSYNSTTVLPAHKEYDITGIDPSVDLLWGCYPETGSYLITASSYEDVPVTMSHMLSQVTVQVTTAGLDRVINITDIAGVSITPGKKVDFSIKDGKLTTGGDATQNISHEWDQLGSTIVTSKPCMVYTKNAEAFQVNIGSMTLNVNGSAKHYTDLTATFNKKLLSGFSYTVRIHINEAFVPPLPKIPAAGGISKGYLIPVPAAFAGSPSLTWTASVATLSGKSPDGGRTLVHHEAVLVDASGNQLTVTGVYPPTTTGSYPMSDSVYVKFPKIYWPNRHIPGIKARVTVKISDGSGAVIPYVFDVEQDPLQSRGFVVGNVGHAAFSGLGSSYMQYYTGYGTPGANSPVSILKISDYELISTHYTNTSPTIDSRVTYLHYASSSYTRSLTWASAKYFMAREGLTLFVCDENSATHIDYLNNSDSPMSAAGYNFVTLGTWTSSTNNDPAYLDLTRQSIYNTRIGQFLTQYCPNQITSNVKLTGINIDHSSATAWPPGAVVVSQNATNAILIIDPVRRLIYCGEGQMFQDATNQNFQRNFMHYVANAARYGSHFQDLFIDDTHPNSTGLPPIWDVNYWGANAWKIPVGMP